MSSDLSEPDSVWTGASDNVTESEWEWNSGDPEMMYVNWDVGQPGKVLVYIVSITRCVLSIHIVLSKHKTSNNLICHFLSRYFQHISIKLAS